MSYKGKYARPSRVPLPLRIALVLLCLVLLSTHFTGGLYARYRSTADGSDSARVAKFDVRVTGDKQSVLVSTEGTTQNQLVISIVNQSEVAVKYDITVTCAETVKGLSVSMGSETKSLATTREARFEPNDPLAPNADTPHTQTLIFLVDWNAFTEDVTGATATMDLTFDIVVHVEQVD